MIAAGRVEVNGELIVEQGRRVDPERDEIRVPFRPRSCLQQHGGMPDRPGPAPSAAGCLARYSYVSLKYSVSREEMGESRGAHRSGDCEADNEIPGH
jgi:hypothetical protein